mmetsp:Transcript_21428/g.32678  ORF Transcript_21428/g.32678 Transcript_21428/m.32678 type:complete len:1013 (-) Transcript_21428:1436-4474(-)|eukprot:CAMPEP_0196802698 /NCGR_PEP_ID=MMETSP1362-20130617/2269_1 /TAXON_ID=163516 /ORGANISM="Leptocylindrus danicus, Strain CCMP1856" /LENGTH=1012 /DNA_ID=CAMNT_0042174065 /DNA_START=68 /DNA_END=3106 /DNA_ORIENTATION=-
MPSDDEKEKQEPLSRKEILVQARKSATNSDKAVAMPGVSAVSLSEQISGKREEPSLSSPSHSLLENSEPDVKSPGTVSVEGKATSGKSLNTLPPAKVPGVVSISSKAGGKNVSKAGVVSEPKPSRALERKLRTAEIVPTVPSGNSLEARKVRNLDLENSKPAAKSLVNEEPSTETRDVRPGVHYVPQKGGATVPGAVPNLEKKLGTAERVHEPSNNSMEVRKVRMLDPAEAKQATKVELPNEEPSTSSDSCPGVVHVAQKAGGKNANLSGAAPRSRSLGLKLAMAETYLEQGSHGSTDGLDSKPATRKLTNDEPPLEKNSTKGAVSKRPPYAAIKVSGDEEKEGFEDNKKENAYEFTYDSVDDNTEGLVVATMVEEEVEIVVGEYIPTEKPFYKDRRCHLLVILIVIIAVAAVVTSLLLESAGSSSDKETLIVPPLIPSSAPTLSDSPSNVPTSAIKSTYPIIDGTKESNGVMFDITVKDAIFIRGMDIHTKEISQITVEIFSKPGSHVDFESSDRDWISLSDNGIEVIGRGPEELTALPAGSLDLNVIIGGGDRRAFYVTLSNVGKFLLCSGGESVGQVFTQLPGGMKIHDGVGVKYLFGGTTSPDVFNFNGVIRYNDVSQPSSSPSQSVSPSLSPSISSLPTSSSKPTISAVPIGGSTSSPSLGYGGDVKKLATTYAAGNGSAGNMFDVVVKGGNSRQVAGATGITVREFNIHTSDAVVYELELYTKSDSHIGFEQDDTIWENIGNTTVEGKGEGLATRIPAFSFFPVVIFEGTVQAFYITLTVPSILYTNGQALSSVYASSAELDILEGTGVTYAFGINYSPRIWNGAIFYSDGTDDIIFPTGSPSESRHPTSAPSLSFRPSVSISPTDYVIPCFDIPNWIDYYGDDCTWYGLNDPDGCPQYGGTLGTGDLSAFEACCECGGGFDGYLPSATPSLSPKPTTSNPPTQNPTISMMPSAECFDVEDWIDDYGDNCTWYELYDPDGCPLYGGVPGTGNLTASKACCECSGGF